MSSKSPAPKTASGDASAPLGKLFKVLGDKYPNYKSQLDSVEGLANKAVKGMDAAAPAMEKTAAVAQKASAKAHEMHLEQYLPMLVGLAMCFFGGSFAMLVTVIETVRVVCWDDIKASYVILKRNYDVAAEQSRKDDLIDADGNGIADVLEIEKKELISRKIGVLVKSVDIAEVQSAGRTLLAAFFSVVAALRVRAARALALAGSLAKTARESIPLERILEENLPADQKKWSAIVADTVFNGLSVAIAFGLRSSEGYVHCGVRGASLFVKNAIKIAQERKLVEPEMTLENQKARILVGLVAVMGIMFQVANGGALPFPVNILLFPLTALEYIIKTVTSSYL